MFDIGERGTQRGFTADQTSRNNPSSRLPRPPPPPPPQPPLALSIVETLCWYVYSRVYPVTVTESVRVLVVDSRVIPVVVASQVVAELVGVGVIVDARGLDNGEPQGRVVSE